MAIIEINRQGTTETDSKLNKKLDFFEKLLGEIRKQEIPAETEAFINTEIVLFNNFTGSDGKLRRQLAKTQSAILRRLEKDSKIVPKNYYRNLWMVIGMSAFGIPLGAAFGAALHNMSLLALGIPIGMGIGIAVGASMDQKAFTNGKQLELSLEM